VLNGTPLERVEAVFAYSLGRRSPGFPGIPWSAAAASVFDPSTIALPAQPG